MIKGKIFQRAFKIVLALIMVLSPVDFAFAKLSESQLYMFSQNNILFYDPTGTAECEPGTITGDKVTVIGDSISVGAKGYYESQIPNVDLAQKTFNGTTYELIQVSKTFNHTSSGNYSGMDIAKVLEEQSEMRPYLVFALGTNSAGAVTDAAIDELMNLV